MKKTVQISEIEYRLQSAKNKELNNIMSPMSEASIEARVAIQCFEEVLNLLKCTPSIPTDEEIQEKALKSAMEVYDSLDKLEYPRRINRRAGEYSGYMKGYKQALKDLGLCK